jgi:hypothetical protein
MEGAILPAIADAATAPARFEFCVFSSQFRVEKLLNWEL